MKKLLTPLQSENFFLENPESESLSGIARRWYFGILEGEKFSQLTASGEKFYWLRKYFVQLSNKSLSVEHLRPLFHLDRHKNFFICLRGNFMQFFNELLRPFPDCWRKHRVLLLRAPLDLRGRDLLLNQARYSIVISFMKISAQPLPSVLYS